MQSAVTITSSRIQKLNQVAYLIPQQNVHVSITIEGNKNSNVYIQRGAVAKFSNNLFIKKGIQQGAYINENHFQSGFKILTAVPLAYISPDLWCLYMIHRNCFRHSVGSSLGRKKEGITSL